MGGVMQTLFGGSSNKNGSTQSSNSQSTSNSYGYSTSESGNKAFDYIMNAMGGNVQQGNNAFQNIGALLGLGGDQAAADGAMNNYLNSSGYKFMLDQGSKAITGNASAKGLLNSGATAKALTQYGQNIGTQFFNNYLDKLAGVFQGGMAGVNAIGSAGNYSQSQSENMANSQSTSTSTGSSWGKGSSSNGIIPVLFG